MQTLKLWLGISTLNLVTAAMKVAQIRGQNKKEESFSPSYTML